MYYNITQETGRKKKSCDTFREWQKEGVEGGQRRGKELQVIKVRARERGPLWEEREGIKDTKKGDEQEMADMKHENGRRGEKHMLLIAAVVQYI